MTAMTDEELMEHVQKGDPRAFDELYKRYCKKMFVYCSMNKCAKYCEDQDCEDFVQVVFLRVAKASQSFDPKKGLFKSWIYRIAHNYCITLKKKCFLIMGFKKLIGKIKPPPVIDGSVDNLRDPEKRKDLLNKIEGTIQNQDVDECIDNLREKQEKEVLLLYYLLDKKYREIAQVLGISVSTVKNRVEPAQKKVTQCLRQKGYKVASVKLTKHSLINLGKENMPDEILQSLKTLENQVFPNEKDFLNAVERHIGDEQTVRYKELILKHADVKLSISITQKKLKKS